MRPKVAMRAALDAPALLGGALGGESRATWRVLLMAAMGEPLTAEELVIFSRITGGRSLPPTAMVEELLGIVGRRGGKTSAMAALLIYLGELCDHRDRLVRGERGVVLLIAPDQRQARVALEYAAGVLEASPVLRQTVMNRTADTIEFASGITIEVRSASFRRLRGVTCVAVLADEACFWYSDESSANADTEILNAVRPTLATTGGPLIIISSPHARRGEAYETWRKHFGPDGDSSILVAQGASREFNPSLPQRVVDRALERDHAAASAEYLAIWRADIESFLSVEAVSAVVQPGVAELGPLRNEFAYSAFVDPSGGSVDSMTIAIAHMDKSRGVLDCLRERRAPFNPEDVVEEFALLLKRYGLSSVVGDRYAGEWPREAFKRRGVTYLPSAKPKGDIYRDVLPKINAREVALLDNARLINQLVGLERKTARGGRDSIDHAPGGHDDLANAAAGVLVHLTKPRPSTTIAPARGHW